MKKVFFHPQIYADKILIPIPVRFLLYVLICVHLRHLRIKMDLIIDLGPGILN